MTAELMQLTPSRTAAAPQAPGARGFGYQPALDGLRALAILGVILTHGGFGFTQSDGSTVLFAGEHGVTVFFAISGYLITSLLLDEHARTGRIDLPEFYWRRVVRLAPALLAVIAATSVWMWLTRFPAPEAPVGVASALTYTTDIVEAIWGNGPVTTGYQFTWTLGVEEQFYLLWPLALILALRLGKRSIAVGVIAAGVIASWLARHPWNGPLPHDQLFFSPLSHLDALALGCLVAILFVAFPASRALRVAFGMLGIAGAAALTVLFLPNLPVPFLRDIDGNDFGVAAIASAAMVGGVVAWPRSLFGDILSARPMVYVGKISYSLYLWNLLTVFVCEFFTGVAPSDLPGWAWLVWAAGLLLVGSASYRFVERPLRTRLGPGSAFGRALVERQHRHVPRPPVAAPGSTPV